MCLVELEITGKGVGPKGRFTMGGYFKKTERVCPYCGVTFKPFFIKQFTCGSKECRKKRRVHRYLWERDLKNKKCSHPDCTKLVGSRNGNYCCREHYLDHVKITRRTRPVDHTHCQYCGEKLIHYWISTDGKEKFNKSKKYCNAGCAAKENSRIAHNTKLALSEEKKEYKNLSNFGNDLFGVCYD